MKIHKELTLEKRSKFSLLEQLANVGMDIDRVIRAKNQGDLDYSNKTFERALELLDLTIADSKNSGHRLRELGRVREALKDYFWGDNEYNSTDEQWYNYFYNFNYAAALAKGK